VNLTAMSSWDVVAQLMTGDTDGFPTCPTSPAQLQDHDAGPLGIRMSRLRPRYPALPACEVRRGQVAGVLAGGSCP
jgi:hypothetical protein